MLKTQIEQYPRHQNLLRAVRLISLIEKGTKIALNHSSHPAHSVHFAAFYPRTNHFQSDIYEWKFLGNAK